MVLSVGSLMNHFLLSFSCIGCLVRSVTPQSLYTPHTGNMGYDAAITKIPAAAITVEDAIMLKNMQLLGKVGTD